ncbi:MAG: glycosyltransferase family 4 protein [Gammaproteobacteria bacterium]|nr:glycosyltransferase family 4 protein [Gammaproteobacteria bacterium]
MQLQKRQPLTHSLLIIGYVWPEPNSSAAGTRMMQLIELLQSQNWNITFSSPSTQGEHRTDLSALEIEEHPIELNNESFDTFIQRLAPEMVIFDRFMMEEQFGWRVEKHAPNALRVLNTEDLHSLRAVRQQCVKEALKETQQSIDIDALDLHNKDELFRQMAQTDLAKREISAIFRCDLSLMISEFEHAFLVSHFQVPSRQLCYLPFLYPESALSKPTNNDYDFRQHFVVIGNFRHEPNWDAVLWLKQSIWPKIRAELPNAELHIYGAYPPKKATQLHNEKQGFKVLGWTEDAFEVLSQARVCLAPLRFGAGIKGKLAESMLCGTPSVTTSIGSESMLNSANDNWSGRVANTPEDFAAAAITLYQDKTLWQAAQKTGTALVKSRYLKPQPQQAHFITQYETLISTLTQHRQQNFMGAILNHHHHKSTQYMAQWIEAKNRP